ncbi:MAG: hypothetical protein ACYCS7_06050 [Acidimicrobiales bacterium]
MPTITLGDHRRVVLGVLAQFDTQIRQPTGRISDGLAMSRPEAIVPWPSRAAGSSGRAHKLIDLG